MVPRQGGVLDFVIDGVNGFFYEPNDAMSLAHVLRRISSDEIDRVQLGRQARAAAAHFSTPHVTAIVESLYETVLE